MEPTASQVATPGLLPDLRTLAALLVALVGLLIPAVLVVWLGRGKAPAWTASELTSLAGLFTGIVGTLVGAFLGVQVAAAGAQQAQKAVASANQQLFDAHRLTAAATQRAAEAEAKANRAIQLLPDQQRASFR